MRPAIESAASDWIARRDAGFSSAEQIEFEQWLSDPAHARVFRRHEQAWHLFSRPHTRGEAPILLHEIRRRAERRRRRRTAIVGATLSLLLVVGAVWRTVVERPVFDHAIPASAHVVRQERRTLPDGSVVELKSGAEIVVDYTTKFRRVTLRSGVAHFQVAKNPERPFIVSVNDVEVRAVGTAFLVQRSAAKMEVLVTEGKVAVNRRVASQLATTGDTSISETALAIAKLGVGERAVIELAGVSNTKVDALDAAAISERLAWRAPRLEFTGTRLSDAVGLINQFNRVKMTIEDPSIAALEVSGFFRADNADTFLRLIEQSLGVRGERRGDLILLRKAR